MTTEPFVRRASWSRDADVRRLAVGLFGAIAGTVVAVVAVKATISSPLMMFLVPAVTFAILATLGASPATQAAVLPVPMLIAFVFTRPTILGEIFGFVGCLLWLLIGVVLHLRYPGAARRLRLGFVVLVVLAYGAWTVLLDAARGGAATRDAIIAVAVVMAVYGAAWAGYSSPLNRRFFRLALVLMTLPAAAYFIDRALGFFARGDNVTVFNPAALGGRDTDYVVWPLGVITNGSGGFFPELGPRLTGWFGEPGLYAGVFVALAAIDLARRDRFGMWQVLAVIGVIASQSSGGMAAYFAMVSAWLLLRPARRGHRGSLGLRALGVVAALGSISAVMGASIGLAGKEAANAASVSDRIGSLSVGAVVHAWLSSPLGQNGSEVTEINLLGSSLVHGPLVIVFAALVIVVWPARLHVARRLAPLLAGLAFTLMFAQPAFANPLWFVLMAFAVTWCARDLDDEGANQEGPLTDEPRSAEDALVPSESPVDVGT